MAHIKRWLILTGAVVMFIVGLASVPTPFPIGAILMAFATALMITYSRAGRAMVRSIRKRFAFVDGRMAWFEDRSNAKMVRVLKTTRPLDARLRVREKQANAV